MVLEIKNLKKAAQRILRAIKNKEKIVLFGDADPDGVSSLVILEESIRSLGGQISAVYFPDREKEGYGLNTTALNYLKEKSPAVLIMLDCGISNFKEASKAKKLDFELIIIDHHEVLDKLPEASIIVDPKQKGDKSLFKALATAGIVFEFTQVLFGKNFPTNLRENFLELTALATIADMMPRKLDNKNFIEEGLKCLEKTARPGLQVFWEIDGPGNYGGVREISSIIISALASGEIKNHLAEAYLLLISKDKKTAEILARNLLGKSYQKHLRIKEITGEVSERIARKMQEPIVFEGGSLWEVGLLGSVASKICHKYQKPTFIFRKGTKESIGATRNPVEVNGVEAMKSCSKLLKTFGGHPLAAGFTVKNENLDKFKNCLFKFFNL